MPGRAALACPAAAPIDRYHREPADQTRTSSLPRVDKGLSARHTVVQRIAFFSRKADRDLAHDFHDLQRNDIPIGTGGRWSCTYVD